MGGHQLRAQLLHDPKAQVVLAGGAQVLPVGLPELDLQGGLGVEVGEWGGWVGGVGDGCIWGGRAVPWDGAQQLWL
jgi:hypothetical protein